MTLRALADAVRALPVSTLDGYVERVRLDSVLQLIEQAAAPDGLDVERLVTAFDRAGWHLNGEDYKVVVKAAAEYARLLSEAVE